MSRSSLEYLRHILDETSYLRRQSDGLSKEQFLQDETLTRAFARSIEIIGEAAKQVPTISARSIPIFKGGLWRE